MSQTNKNYTSTSNSDKKSLANYRINSLLQAAADCASALLSDEDFERGINRALAILGKSAGVDRLALSEHFSDCINEIGYVVVQYEWLSYNATSQLHHPELSRISYDGLEDCYHAVNLGKHWGGLLKTMPEPFRSGQEKLGVKATYAIPIMVEGQYWGIIGLDFCQTARQLCDAQIAVLKTAATCIGSAIQRERNRKAKEQAAIEKAAQLAESNQVLSLRDRWLEATANAANQLLEIADLDEGMNAALKMLGEGLDCDRVGVMQNFEGDTAESAGFVRLIYEWDSPYASSQILHPKLHQVSTEGVEHWVVRLKAGDWIGGFLSELNQPFRDAMAQLNVKSTYAVPVFVNDIYWGTLGIDYCREPKRLTPAEIAVFKIAASCIGSAIYRPQIQQEKERAELAILNERNRMAREIHDTLAQAFTGISLQLEAARNILSTQPEAAQERLLRARNLAQEGLSGARRSVRALRPEALESGSLSTALHQLIDKMVSGTDIKTEILIGGEPQFLNPEVEVDLFRITQEAIANTLQHAQASEIFLQLIHENDTVHLQIKDNGKGFNPQLLLGEGFGLIGMRERCDRLKGNLVINSAIGQGTEIIVTVANNE